MDKKLSHLDAEGNPSMVDVSGKVLTARMARAEIRVFLGPEILKQLTDQQFATKKGSVIHTAIIAATMAVKRTHELIPLCHSLPVSSCKTHIEAEGEAHLRIVCTVKTNAPTGVEMEALHGASVAALTIYDMCKALSHDIIIQDLQLMEKTGGKNDFKRQTS